ncbi:MAG: ATP-grasp domain-containing protein [Planctomycetes bacterium]|nr:ATP-grasp domain-containing protein [Planctomycetota bacterium]
MRVTVLYNQDQALALGRAEDGSAVAAVQDAARAAAQACQDLGHATTLLPAPEDPEPLLRELAATRPDVVLNLVESLRGDPGHEATVAGLLELAGFRFTGSPAQALHLGLDKTMAKAVLAAAGVPVPRGVAVERGDESLADVPWPAIVKPGRQDASHGIDQQSVVADPAAAWQQIERVARHYGTPVLVEEFVAGREFNVAVLGHDDQFTVLPLSEIDFTAYPPGRPPLVTYAAKWLPESPEYRGTPAIAARALPPATEERIRVLAQRACRALRVRDYARVDLRLHAERGPLVLEVNPNPDLSPDAGFARAAARAGLDHPRLIGRILDGALHRGPHPA